MGKASGYIIVLLNFVLAIFYALVLVVIFMQGNKINTLRQALANQSADLAICSEIKKDCINQLGCFYRDPMEALRNNKKRTRKCSDQPPKP